MNNTHVQRVRRYYPGSTNGEYLDIGEAGRVLQKFQTRFIAQETKELRSLNIPGFAQNTAEVQEQKRAEVTDGIMKQRLIEWTDLTKRVPPSFRHYFTELNDVPSSWFAMRLNYVRSVATTSVVGHIMGLGDRHTSNILVDKKTGELVHIDLGIAFDQVWYLFELRVRAMLT